ncbi:stage VI sporulation protein F [Compostibacillus humi]|uniref:Stage VI sporulation protein F n=1 Tax=Compostibacillus humi TaxID=1245525 RepID=A0A8J2ZP99_9BACI|nr:stage VI sporulation protein F [Compostibacillus humi]GGH68861.1 stage VI sporulation protein F [Compostibacillus humi]HLT54790.1 stage VI sporulation protein F [Bacillota bacterium]
MNHFQKGLFDKIQQNSNIRPEDIFKVADAVKHADFSDEETVRRLVRQLAKMAGKPVSKEKEDKLVQSITNNNIPSDFSQMFKK